MRRSRGGGDGMGVVEVESVSDKDRHSASCCRVVAPRVLVLVLVAAASSATTWYLAQPPGSSNAEHSAQETPAEFLAAAATPMPPTPVPVPLMPRHPLQQQEGLPAGPEAPAPTPAGGEIWTVKCETTAGYITIEVHSNWSPNGAKRFMDMVRSGFFTSEVALFRCVQGFICQTGIPGVPALHTSWTQKGAIADDKQWLNASDPLRMKRGYVSFAGVGPHTRCTQFLFACRDMGLGSSPWEVPFGTLVGEESFTTMDHWYAGYGDMQVFGGKAPDQLKIYRDGAQYVKSEFPEIDFIKRCDDLSAGTPQRTQPMPLV